jgi:Ribbon-helix-helix protein, copG family
MTLYIPEDVQRLLEKHKDKTGKSISELARRAIVQYLERGFDLPDVTYEHLKQHATRIGMTYQEFLDVTLGGIIEKYSATTSEDWITDDSNPSPEVIQNIATLYDGRETDLRLFSLRRIQREMTLYSEAGKLIRQRQIERDNESQ